MDNLSILLKDLDGFETRSNAVQTLMRQLSHSSQADNISNSQNEDLVRAQCDALCWCLGVNSKLSSYSDTLSDLSQAIRNQLLLKVFAGIVFSSHPLSDDTLRLFGRLLRELVAQDSMQYANMIINMLLDYSGDYEDIMVVVFQDDPDLIIKLDFTTRFRLAQCSLYCFKKEIACTLQSLFLLSFDFDTKAFVHSDPFLSQVVLHPVMLELTIMHLSLLPFDSLQTGLQKVLQYLEQMRKS
ncbi:hypothetical protein MIR68_008331 [Amoeboaphelidium protococcarum]|nr:hypothetical protein MIR68_008331 [Amoeboaphelidium protococcarum]